MVARFFEALYKEVKGLHQAAYVLAAFTLGSQVLALVRDRLLAHQFGAGNSLDLYYAAFRVPDLLYVLFASTLSVYVLIPFVAERVSSRDSSKAKLLLSQIFTLFTLSYTILAFLTILIAPYVVPYLFPGFEHETETLILLLRVLLLQPLFLGLSSLYGVITQFTHRFVLYAVSPILYNVGIIAGVVFFVPSFGVVGLAYGVVLGAFLHLAVQIPFITRHELSPWFTTRFSLKDIREVLVVSVPRALTLSLHQLMLLGLMSLASTMAQGSVSVVQFAYNLQSVPLAVIAVSYSVAAFPILAELYAEKAYDRFKHHLMTALQHILFWSLPLIALFVVLRAQFVRVVLGTGAFDWSDTRLTAAVLAVFSVSLVFQGIHLLLVRSFYAVENTKIPFFVTLLSSGAALLLAYLFLQIFHIFPAFQSFFVSILRLEGVVGSEVIALPLGYTLALFLHAVILLHWGKKLLFIDTSVLAVRAYRAFLASLLAGVCAYGALRIVGIGIETDTLFSIATQGIVGGVAGVMGAVFGYIVVRSPELREVYRSLHARVFKTKVVGAQDEDTLAL